MDGIRESFASLYDGKRGSRPHCLVYTEFNRRWGIVKTLYEVCQEDLEKVARVYQCPIMDFLQLLTYLNDKAEAERAEYEYQDQLRKAKHH